MRELNGTKFLEGLAPIFSEKRLLTREELRTFTK